MAQKLENVEVGQSGVALVFTVYKDGQEIAKQEFNQRSILVGRGDSANLRIDDAKASKLHAVIDITTKDDIHILDLGSTNGTKVNGEKIHRQPLKAGDEITVGHTSFKFEFRELVGEEEKSVERFQATFETYFNEQPEAGEDKLSGRERRKVIEVAQIWGDSIVQMTHFMRPSRVTIGESHDCNFFAPAEYLNDAKTFNVVVNVGKDYYLQFTETFSGTIDHGGKQTALQELVEKGLAQKARDGKQDVLRFKIEPDARVRLELGSLTFLIQRVRPAKGIPADFFKQLDYGFLSVLGLVLFVIFGGTLGVWVLTLIGALVPPPQVDELTRNDDIVQALVIAPEKLPEIPIPKVQKKKDPGGNPDAGEGDKARGDEGKRGKKDGKVDNSRGGAFKAPTDKDIVDGAGVLGALTAQNADLNAIFGSGKLAGGMNDNIGGLVGSTTADQRGSGGLGLKGEGKGGGGNSLNIGGL
ncbi:MAG TPA: FHA domain-containing protein, partial [bacterium]|nr:FHA domain-containing protein [bacterium]